MRMKAFAQTSLALLTLFLSFSVLAQDSNSRPTLYLIGDSTVNTPTKGQQGWGTPLPDFFNLTNISVVNRARGARTSRTFYTEGLWHQVGDSLKPPDFVLMQFRHHTHHP